MEDRKMLFRVGAMVFGTLLITAILVLMFGNLPKWIKGGYTVYVHFNQAPGVADGTPVRKNGIRIGEVKKVAMNEANTEVIATVAIQDRWKIYTNEVCRAQTNLLGDAYLEFVRQPAKAAAVELIKPGAELKGEAVTEPIEMVQDVKKQFNTTISSVRETSDTFRGTSEDLSITLKKLNAMLDDNKDGIKAAIQGANDMFRDTREIIGDENTKKNLRKALEDLPQMISDTHETVRKMQETMQTVNKNLQNIEGFTKPLGERGATLIGNLEKGTRNLDALVSDMTMFTEKLNSSEGTIGLLINDPELYQHLNRAARNIDEVSRQLKPIVDDARVFTDKIARHPESLGVRGALEKKAGIK